MSKYLSLFEQDSEYRETFKTLPNVSNVIEDEAVYYLDGYSGEYLTFKILSDGEITWKTNHANAAVKEIQYSINNGAWTSITSSTTGASFNVSEGDTVRFKGSNEKYGTNNSYYNMFNTTCKFDLQGNIMSLVGGDNFATIQTMAANVFTGLFKDCTNLINAKKLLLPVMSLSTQCYQRLFYGCTSLISAPKLPATTYQSCYEYMFCNCSSLTKAPDLPSKTAYNYCYSHMFDGCSSLIKIPKLNATNLRFMCYCCMFKGCTSLVDLSNFTISADNVEQSALNGMFQNCSSLKYSPIITVNNMTGQSCLDSMFSGCSTLTDVPITITAPTLTTNCFKAMFLNCTSLTKSPLQLPWTTLANGCYDSMFYGCTSLTTAPELPSTTLATRCYGAMFYNCTKLTKAPDLPAPILVANCYTDMLRNCTKINYIKCLATDISATECTLRMTQYVANSGTFVKAVGMEDWTTSVNGIPKGWTVEEPIEN